MRTRLPIVVLSVFTAICVIFPMMMTTTNTFVFTDNNTSVTSYYRTTSTPTVQELIKTVNNTKAVQEQKTEETLIGSTEITAAAVTFHVDAQNGYPAFDFQSNSTSLQQQILDACAYITKYAQDNGTTYQMAHPVNWFTDNPAKKIDCSMFASNVLMCVGVLARNECQSSSTFATNRWKFKEISDIASLEPGDLAVWKGHVAIYAGNGLWYSFGSTGGIQKSPYAYSSKKAFVKGLRVWEK